MTHTGDVVIDQNQPRYPCPCCKYDCQNEKCILCSYCNNWFHQHCAKLSDKRFDTLGNSVNLRYKCKFCKCKKGKCALCNKVIQNECLDKIIYCISCKDWYCHGCLALSPSQINSYMTTDIPYFCCDCSADYYCPICKEICRDKCIFCKQCEQFLHAKCSKLTRRQLRSQKKNYLCHICVKENLPVNVISKQNPTSSQNPLFHTQPNMTITNSAQNISNSYTESDKAKAGCGLCIECDTECLICDNCSDLQRVCSLCLSCKTVDIPEYNKILSAYDSQKNLFIVHANISSLDANKTKLKGLLFKSVINPDIIAISETRLNDDYNIAKTDIDGYHQMLFKHSVTGVSDYGGVGLYISKNLNYDCRPDLAFDFDGCETKFIELKTKQLNRKNIIIGAIYRHPHDNHDTFYSNFGMLLKKITEKYSVILCGDINVNTAPENRASIAKDYKNLLLSFGCINLINKYTRIQTDINGLTTKSTIDHIITNINTNQVESGVITYHVSDHLPIFGLFNMGIERQRQPYITKRFYNNAGKHKYVDNLKESLQNVFDNAQVFDDPDLALQKLVSEIQSSESIAFPLRNLSKKKAKKFRKPWMTSGILKSIDHRDKLFREQLGKNDPELSREYRQYRNKVTRVIENAKDLDMYKSFEFIVDNPKKVWCKINTKFLHKKHCGSAIPSEIRVSGERINDKNKIANKLNEHFVNKGRILASELPNSEISVLDSMKPRNENSITSWDYFLVQEVLDIIKKDICINKSSGCDNVPAVLIKWAADIIAPILVRIFNRCLELGEYPGCLKIAKVTALHKGSDRLNVDNYRSISVLTHINKIFEKLLHARLNDFVTKHNILENNQYGFRKGHSTSHGITQLHETILKSIEKKKICVALFIDLKSAFDTINHEILELKLDHYGVRGMALKLLSSYLKDRKQFIKAGDIESAILYVLCGVPQGSVLGPLLFIIYINDITTCSELSSLLFADDAVLTFSHESLKYLERKFNSEMKKMHHWFIANKLTLNLKKTKYMIFSKLQKKKAKEHKFRININKFCIKQVSEMKYILRSYSR